MNYTPTPTITFEMGGSLGTGATITGGGVPSGVLILRSMFIGFTYRWEASGAHPVALRQSNGGAAVTAGVSEVKVGHSIIRFQ